MIEAFKVKSTARPGIDVTFSVGKLWVLGPNGAGKNDNEFWLDIYQRPATALLGTMFMKIPWRCGSGLLPPETPPLAEMTVDSCILWRG